jgi:ribosomal protein S27AE
MADDGERKMNNACPACGTAYSVQPQHVGRRITCRKCGAGLVVDETGLKLADAPPPTPPAEKEPAAPAEADIFGTGGDGVPPPLVARPKREPAGGSSVTLVGRWQSLGDLPATACFALGSLLVLLFVFLPLLDLAKAARLTAKPREDALAAAQGAAYGYLWGLFAGFVLAGLGALGFLNSAASPVRRVLGAVVLGGQLLLVFALLALVAGFGLLALGGGR